MKFYIKRTSHGTQLIGEHKKRPCDGAMEVGHDHDVQLYSLEIKDLNHLIEFAKQEGELVLDTEPTFGPGPQLEIYDDYKE
jgi:hypothetical protein